MKLFQEEGKDKEEAEVALVYGRSWFFAIMPGRKFTDSVSLTHRPRAFVIHWRVLFFSRLHLLFRNNLLAMCNTHVQHKSIYL